MKLCQLRLPTLFCLATLFAGGAGAATDPASPATVAAPLTLTPLTTVAPHLSDEACQQRLSGWVDLDFAVMPDGKVADVKVTAAQPKGAFDEAAIHSVATRNYPPQAAPVKMHQHLPMSFDDCRPEQLRPHVPAAGEPLPSQGDCVVLASEARSSGDPIDAGESGRAALAEGAQEYLAPTSHCYVPGKKFKPGTRLEAHLEFKGYTLVSVPKRSADSGFWVRSNDLKDTTPQAE